MANVCRNPACALYGRSVDAICCATCGGETAAIVDDNNGAPQMDASDVTSNEVRGGDDEVVFETAAEVARKGRLVSGVLFVAAVVFVYVVLFELAATNLVVFALMAIYYAQFGVMVWRSRRLRGPVVTNLDLEHRLSPIIVEVCARVKCTIPCVRIQESIFLAAVQYRRKIPVLRIAPSFLEAVSDEELRAVIAHEMCHVASDDRAAASRRAKVVCLVPYAFVLGVVFFHWSFVVWSVSLVPAIHLLSWATGFSKRWREIRADLRAAELTGDPAAMSRALVVLVGLAEAQRRQIVGSGWKKWLMFPMSIRATTHPSLEQRQAALAAVASE